MVGTQKRGEILTDVKADILFEVSWEVCNKVGGIYTVVKSKVECTKNSYKDYFLIGPYSEEKAKIDLDEKDIPNYLKAIFRSLSDEGITCHYGTWNIAGEPTTILIDFVKAIGKKNEIKTKLWDDYKIDSISSNWEFEEPIIWSWAVSRFLEEFWLVNKGKKIVAHFHEWLAGSALLQLKKKKIKIATVFTTHATMLGRAIASSGQDLYGTLNSINPTQKAYELGVQDKFLIEKACAKNADVFTTVSEITGIEAEKILERKPEVLVLNGLDIQKFPTMEEVSIKHAVCREKIREFLTFNFFPHYSFDLNHTMFIFIIGRYEFKNKGIDIFIKALANLNERLKKEDSKRNVAVFFWIPQETMGVKTALLENKNYYRHIKNFIQYNEGEILSHIVYDFVSGKDISKDQLFTKDFLMEIKKDVMHFKRKGNPPMVTHNIIDEDNDPIVANLLRYGLDNKEDDKVKTILYPVYLDGNDGLIDLPYYDAMAGCHLGVFPSYYEPWGYTTLETAALGVPAFTSDLSGFGRFIQNKVNHNMEDGIFVLKRLGKSEEDIINEFAELLYKFCKRDKHDRAQNKINAKQLSGLADWKIFIQNYIKAHNLALEKLG